MCRTGAAREPSFLMGFLTYSSETNVRYFIFNIASREEREETKLENRPAFHRKNKLLQ